MHFNLGSRDNFQIVQIFSKFFMKFQFLQELLKFHQNFTIFFKSLNIERICLIVKMIQYPKVFWLLREIGRIQVSNMNSLHEQDDRSPQPSFRSS